MAAQLAVGEDGAEGAVGVGEGVAQGAAGGRPQPAGAQFARPPVFEGLAAGLMSTAPDVLAVLTALADGGAPLLAPGSVGAMTADQPTAEQRAASAGDLDAGTGTSAWVDPHHDLAGVLLSQRLCTGPEDVADWFWAVALQCL